MLYLSLPKCLCLLFALCSIYRPSVFQLALCFSQLFRFYYSFAITKSNTSKFISKRIFNNFTFWTQKHTILQFKFPWLSYRRLCNIITMWQTYLLYWDPMLYEFCFIVVGSRLESVHNTLCTKRRRDRGVNDGRLRGSNWVYDTSCADSWWL